MKERLKIIAIAVSILFLGLFLLPQENWAKGVKQHSYQVTIYNNNLGVVKDLRQLYLSKGINDVVFDQVASKIDPTSVHYKSKSSTVLEQNYQYDLVSRQKLLEKYLGKEITITRTNPETGKEIARLQGTLLSIEGDKIGVLATGKKILLSPLGQIELPTLPQGLLVKPTLLLKIKNNSHQKGKHLAEISYLTKGMSWSADYVVVSNSEDNQLDLEGWVTLNNRSGASYHNARLKLVAGDINLAKGAVGQQRYRTEDIRAMKSLAPEPQFKESGLFEYHLYTMQRKTDILNNQSKQVSFLTAKGVKVKKRYIFDPLKKMPRYWGSSYRGEGKQKVAVILEMKNSKKSGLGMPLPKGRVRAFKKDKEGQLQFVGEDLIDHTPKDERVRLKIGEAFDVVGERKEIDFKRTKWCKWERGVELSLRNRKKVPITVTAVERMPYRGMNWKVLKTSHKFKKKSSHAFEYRVKLAAGQTKKINFRVRTWCW